MHIFKNRIKKSFSLSSQKTVFRRGDKLYENLINIKFNRLFDVAEISNFNNDFRPFLEDVIKDIYYSHGDLIFQLRLSHIDRAIFKFKQAQEKTRIINTKQYFKSCIVSAIKEYGLNQLAYEDVDE